MKRSIQFLILLTILCLHSVAILAVSSFQGKMPKSLYLDGELLVKFIGGPKSAKAISAHNKLGMKVLKTFPRSRWQLVKLPSGVSVEEGIAGYETMDGTSAVQPNYRYFVSAVPDDPLLPDQWALAKIQVSAAWDYATGSADTVVAVIDSGINYNHSDLAANMWHNPGEIQGNGIDDDSNGYIDDIYGMNAIYGTSDPLDDHSHGSHVSGTIGAVTDNGFGVAGINWDVSLMALKFIGHDGTGYTSGAVECYEYLLMMKERGTDIAVVNNSWIRGGYDPALVNVINLAGAANIASCCAAGNDGDNNDSTPCYPSSYNCDSIISVAAADANDIKPDWSCYGVVSVDLAAPGDEILSTVLNNGFQHSWSGTSMATAHVTGAYALMYSILPTITVAQAKKVLMDSVDKLPQWEGIVASGGRLNIANAIDMVSEIGGSPAKLSFITQPGDANMNTAISPAVEVAVQDIYGNTVTGASTPITLTLSNNPGNGILSGTLTLNAINGVAAFNDLQIDKPGTGYTLTASAEGLIFAESLSFNITTAPLSSVALTGNPLSPLISGTSALLTATPVGGINPEYQFWIRIPGSASKTLLRGYAAANTCSWAPVLVGKYTLLVYAREQGSTIPYKVYHAISYTVKAPPLTSVALAGNPASPVVTGTAITLTATPVGGLLPDYQFWVRVPGSAAKTMLCDYNSSRTCLWTPSIVGTYTLLVYAREHGSGAPYQVYQTLVYQVKSPPITGVSLNGNHVSPTVTGTQVTLTASASGGTTPDYQFWVRVPGSAAKSLLRDYGSSNTCPWTPAIPGTYVLLVYAREHGSSVPYQAYKTLVYSVYTP